jgi:hypothetical protein
MSRRRTPSDWAQEADFHEEPAVTGKVLSRARVGLHVTPAIIEWTDRGVRAIIAGHSNRQVLISVKRTLH